MTQDELRKGMSVQPDPLDDTRTIEVPVPPEARTAAAKSRSLPLHPAQLYSAFTAFFLAALLVAYFTTPHPPGMVFALMLVLEGVSRFVLEMLRAEPAVVGRGTDTLTALPPMSFSMVISVGLVLMGIALWSVFRRAAAVPPGVTPTPAIA